MTSVIVVPASTAASKILCYCWTASLDGTIRYWDFSVPESVKTINIQHPIHSMVNYLFSCRWEVWPFVVLFKVEFEINIVNYYACLPLNMKERKQLPLWHFYFCLYGARVNIKFILTVLNRSSVFFFFFSF